jgi:hypothetical protein
MKNLEHIENTLKDLTEICEKYDIDYRVIGSTAMVAAVADGKTKPYRTPGDVDVLFDADKKMLLYKGLKDVGYSRESQTNTFDKVLPEALERFRKGNQILEPRSGNFVDGRFEGELLLPLNFLPKKYWPKMKLIFGPKLFKKARLRIGETPFWGLSREALLFIFEMSKLPMNVAEGSSFKRQLDEEALKEKYNPKLLMNLEKEKSGVFWGSVPVVTWKNKWVLKMFTKSAKKFVI